MDDKIVDLEKEIKVHFVGAVICAVVFPVVALIAGCGVYSLLGIWAGLGAGGMIAVFPHLFGIGWAFGSSWDSKSTFGINILFLCIGLFLALAIVAGGILLFGAVGPIWPLILVLGKRNDIKKLQVGGDDKNTSYTAKGGDDHAQSSSSFNDSGLSYAANGDYDRAIEDYTKALEIDPNEAVYSNRGIAYTYKGDYDSAIADHTEAIRLDPNNAASYSNRGMTYYKKGDMNSAVADFEASLRIYPDDPGTRVFLEKARNKLGD